MLSKKICDTCNCRDTLKIYPLKEGIYKYYDKQELKSLELFEVITVIPNDEFTGIFRDLVYLFLVLNPLCMIK